MKDLTRFESRPDRLRQLKPPSKNKDLPEDKLVTSINEAAKGVGTQSLTFFVAAVYVAISAAGVRDDSLFFHDKLTLPVANVTIPAEGFFLIAPALLTALHLVIMLHQYYLFEKLAALPWRRRKVKTELFLPSISISAHFPGEYTKFVGGLVFVWFWVTYTVIPLAVLVYLQMSSLRFRLVPVQHCISICLAITLVASSYFAIVTILIKRKNPDLWEESIEPSHREEATSVRGARWRRAVGAATWLVRLSTVALASWFVLSYVQMLQHPRPCDDKRKFMGVFSFRGHLILTSIPERLQRESAERTRSFNFREQDLRCARFVGVGLAGADFRGADLSGARFDGADLRGANFSSLQRRRTNLVDASFVRADLTRARFRGALLMGATLRRANLQEAFLSGADLSKVRMIDANLMAADLTRSRLRGADFRKARLPLAILDYASIELVRFDGAWLDLASFKGAAAFGASFRGARLRGVSGLPLAGVDLQSAWVWGMNSCGALSDFPTHVNLRALRLDPVGSWPAIQEEIVTAAKIPLLSSTLARMTQLQATQQGASNPICFSDADEIQAARTRGWSTYLKEKNLLYDRPGPGSFFEELPVPPPLTEAEYLSSLIRELIRKACIEETETSRGGAKGSTLREVLELRANDEVGRFGQILRQQRQSISCESLAGAAH